MAGKLNRRTFLQQSGAAALAATVTQRARAQGANDKVIVGIIGLGGRGRGHASYFANRDDVDIKWVCDVDKAQRMASFPDQLGSMQGHTPKTTQDMREVFDDPEVDAVIIATPDHWHALATIWACQAGKDVYVEKPPSHNIWEGRKMVEAARKYDRAVQVGGQNRSAAYHEGARKHIQNGDLGPIPLVKVYHLEHVGPFPGYENEPVPEGVDYNRWLGPAPGRPFNEGHFHKGWHWFWDYSGGELADDAFHQLDVARMLLGDPGHPKAVTMAGGHWAYNDARETPDTMAISVEYPDRLLTCDVTLFGGKYMHKTPNEIRMGDGFPDWPRNTTRIEFYGEDKMMYVGRHGGGWQLIKSGPETLDESYGRESTAEHLSNFIDCVRSRKRPNGDIEEGHRSVVLAHLANLSFLMGNRRLEFDSETERVTNIPEANDNLLMRREYRADYAVPDKV